MGMWIGRNRKARVTYGFDEIALVPGRVTINPNEVDIGFRLPRKNADPLELKIPILASAMDGVVNVRFAVAMSKLGGLAVLNLEGVQTRYKNPQEVLQKVVDTDKSEVTSLLQRIYQEPVHPDLIAARVKQIKDEGGIAAVSSIRQRALEFGPIVKEAGADVYFKYTSRYVPIITDGGMSKGGDVCKALACGADAVMVGSAFARSQEAPGAGYHWGMATPHVNLPRGTRIKVGTTGSLKQILFGPAEVDDGSQNLVGAITTCMGNVGARNIAEFQQTEIIIAPSIKTEGKLFQTVQSVGMGTS